MPKWAYRLLDITFLLVLFGVFKNTPLYLLDKALDIFSAFFCLFYLTYEFWLKKNDFYNFGRIVIVVFVFVLIISVYAAFAQYHQKLFDGLASQIDFLQIFTIAFYAYAFRKRKLKVESFEKYLKFFLILNLIILVAFRNFTGSTTSAIGSHAVTFKSNFLPLQFIRFGVMYFFVRFLKQGKVINIIICVFLLFFPNVIIHFERGYFFYTVMLIFLTVMLVRKSRKFFSKFVIGLFVMLILLIVAVSFSGSFGASVLSKYGDIVSGINQGNSDDNSVNYRLKELTSGIILFTNNPYVGSGKLNSQNSVVVTGIEFYPSDIGIIGVADNYGILGVLIFVAILYLSIRTYRRTIRNNLKLSIMTISLAMYFLGICIESIQTAQVMLMPAFWSYLYILYMFSRNEDQRRFGEYQEAVRKLISSEDTRGENGDAVMLIPA